MTTQISNVPDSSRMRSDAEAWQMAADNIGLAYYHAKYLSFYSSPDARQEALIGLFEACRRWDPNKAPLGTYSRPWIKRALIHHWCQDRVVPLPKTWLGHYGTMSPAELRRMASTSTNARRRNLLLRAAGAVAVGDLHPEFRPSEAPQTNDNALIESSALAIYDPDPDAVEDIQARLRVAHEVFDTMSARNRQVVCLAVFWRIDGPTVAEYFGLTKQRISQIALDYVAKVKQAWRQHNA